jgi:DNA-binding NarL/FixJ family response regulator
MATRSQYFHFHTSDLDSLDQTAPLRVIVVDDSPDLREVLCDLLETNKDVEIIARGSDGSEALGLVSAMQPDLVLMDVQMPHVDGIAAAALITMHFPETTVVLMSGDDSPQLRAQCMDCGAHAFIHKPRLGRELEAMIESVRGEQFFNYLRNNFRTKLQPNVQSNA